MAWELWNRKCFGDSGKALHCNSVQGNKLRLTVRRS
jgi:hypothetical protein